MYPRLSVYTDSRDAIARGTATARVAGSVTGRVVGTPNVVGQLTTGRSTVTEPASDAAEIGAADAEAQPTARIDDAMASNARAVSLPRFRVCIPLSRDNRSAGCAEIQRLTENK
jgi:hypothetical protein